MEIYKPSDVYNNETPCVVALGNFDGVHIAHKKLLKTAVKKAKEKKIISVALIFENHPENVLSGSCVSPFITTNEEKAKYILELGIDRVVFLEFSHHFSKMTPENFVKEILKEKLNAVCVICGFHYRFGVKAAGDAGELKKIGSGFGIETFITDPITLHGLVVSSSYIRDFIRNGDMEKAGAFLGRPYKVEYVVEMGKRLGGQLGYPTINQFFAPCSLIPAIGVYITKTRTPTGIYPSITNIGFRPTVENTKMLNMETHIIGINENLYGEKIEVQFYQYLRCEMKFNNTDELVRTIKEDIETVKLYFECEKQKGI